MKVKANQTFIAEPYPYVLFSDGIEYELLAEFNTDKMFSGVCFVIETDNKQIVGFDSDYFTKIK